MGDHAHLPSLSTYPRAEVVAIADPSPERLAQAGERFGIAGQFTDYRAMLDRGDLDGVVVATPHATHFAIAADVLSRGIGLMLEKPMVLRAREARELVRLAEQHRVPLVVGYPYHFVDAAGAAAGADRRRRAWPAPAHPDARSRRWCSSTTAPTRWPTPDVFQWQVTGPLPTTYSEPAVAGGGQGHLQVTHSAALTLWLTDLRPRRRGRLYGELRSES